MGTEKLKPEVFDTITDPKLRAHFERYDGAEQFENGEPEFDPIRQEIADHFDIPYTTEDDQDSQKENHLFIVDNAMVENQRHHRAFCVLIREENGKNDGWYIDGRLPHAVMLRRLYNHYNVPDDDENETILGFLDEQGFPDIEKIQEKAKERGKPVVWFIRNIINPEKTGSNEHEKIAEKEGFLIKL